jgi:hypothetical protein
MCLGWRETCVCRDVLKKRWRFCICGARHTADKNNMRRALCAASVFAARGVRRMFAARLIRTSLRCVPPQVNPQKRLVQPADCLGLVLVWTRTRGLLNVLQLVFGLTYSNLSVYLRFGIRLMVETFKNDPLARVAIPSGEDIESFKAVFAERHPLLTDCWATMDGLKLYLQSSGNSDIQERFYNGWTHDCYVTSVFCFCPDGTIPIAFFNVPGCVHDSQVAEFG